MSLFEYRSDKLNKLTRVRNDKLRENKIQGNALLKSFQMFQDTLDNITTVMMRKICANTTQRYHRTINWGKLRHQSLSLAATTIGWQPRKCVQIIKTNYCSL